MQHIERSIAFQMLSMQPKLPSQILKAFRQIKIDNAEEICFKGQYTVKQGPKNDSFAYASSPPDTNIGLVAVTYRGKWI